MTIESLNQLIENDRFPDAVSKIRAASLVVDITPFAMRRHYWKGVTVTPKELSLLCFLRFLLLQSGCFALGADGNQRNEG